MLLLQYVHLCICRYEHLVLVAGGIGISPFLAILSDIVHRLKEGKPCVPKHVVIVWAIKKSDELPILSMLNMGSIDPVFLDALNLEIQVYVTRESEPKLVSCPPSLLYFRCWLPPPTLLSIFLMK